MTDNAGGESGRQPIAYCPYCSEETLFPRDGGGWECHSCLRAFSVSFHGLVNPAELVNPDGSESR